MLSDLPKVTETFIARTPHVRMSDSQILALNLKVIASPVLPLKRMSYGIYLDYVEMKYGSVMLRNKYAILGIGLGV